MDKTEICMDVTRLPFNRLIGIKHGEADVGLLVALPDVPECQNHLGNVHASALLALAEAGSGQFLALLFGDHAGYFPVVRQIKAKFRKPASGRIAARCLLDGAGIDGWLDELAKRGRLSLVIPMEVVDADGKVVMTSEVEWFIAKLKESS